MKKIITIFLLIASQITIFAEIVPNRQEVKREEISTVKGQDRDAATLVVV